MEESGTVCNIGIRAEKYFFYSNTPEFQPLDALMPVVALMPIFNDKVSAVLSLKIGCIGGKTITQRTNFPQK